MTVTEQVKILAKAGYRIPGLQTLGSTTAPYELEVIATAEQAAQINAWVADLQSGKLASNAEEK